jgi:hypothetical protein
MTTLRQSVSIWKKLGKARGALYQALEGLEGIPSGKKLLARTQADLLQKDIRKALRETACNPPDDLDLEAYDRGLIRPMVEVKKKVKK